MNLNFIPSRFMGANMYIIEANSSVIVIDPSSSISQIERFSNKKVKAVLFTHGHFDHIDHLGEYLGKDIKFYMHKECMKKLMDPSLNLSNQTRNILSFNLEDEDVTFVSENSKFQIDNLTFLALQTFGHTNCSVSYVLENNIFTGDFLFQGSIGRYDFPTSNLYEMQKSIKKFKELKDDFNIYPGHGEATTLNIEKVTNYYFK